MEKRIDTKNTLHIDGNWVDFKVETYLTGEDQMDFAVSIDFDHSSPVIFTVEEIEAVLEFAKGEQVRQGNPI